MVKKYPGLAIEEVPSKCMLNDPYDYGPLINKATGEQAWIELLPLDGEKGAEVDRKINDKLLRRRVQRLTAGDAENNAIERLAGVTVAWSICNLDGEPIRTPCTPENAIDVYKECRWMRNQAATWASDLGNFRPTSSPTSSPTPSTPSDSSS